MSYSFSVRAASKAEALAATAAKLAEVVEQQPIHAKDQEQALATVEMLLSLIETPTVEQDVGVTLSGSVNWNNEQLLTGAQVSANVYLWAKEVR